jgi:hypothetical protein
MPLVDLVTVRIGGQPHGHAAGQHVFVVLFRERINAVLENMLEISRRGEVIESEFPGHIVLPLFNITHCTARGGSVPPARRRGLIWNRSPFVTECGTELRSGPIVEKRLKVAAITGFTAGEMEGNWQGIEVGLQPGPHR